jgi:hypothetical protein
LEACIAAVVGSVFFVVLGSVEEDWSHFLHILYWHCYQKSFVIVEMIRSEDDLIESNPPVIV